MCIFHGLSAVLPFGHPDGRPGLQEVSERGYRFLSLGVFGVGSGEFVGFEVEPVSLSCDIHRERFEESWLFVRSVSNPPEDRALSLWNVIS